VGESGREPATRAFPSSARISRAKSGLAFSGMALLVDACNVLHAAHVVPHLPLRDAEQLCAVIGRSSWARRAVTVVCDGNPPAPAEAPRRVELIFAGPQQEADALIERRIARATGPRHLSVVSNDRRIQRAARRRRARPISSERFLRDLSRDPPRERGPRKPIRPADPDAELAAFGVDPAEARAIEPARGAERPARAPQEDAAPMDAETARWIAYFGLDPADPDAGLRGR
jgi:predicted RNA-binding protein with PIN domain